MAIAVALIREAARHPWRLVEYIDHHASMTVPLRRQMGWVVHELLQTDPDVRAHVRFHGTQGFVLELAHPIPDWLPGDTEIGQRRPFDEPHPQAIRAVDRPVTARLAELLRDPEEEPTVVRGRTAWERLD